MNSDLNAENPFVSIPLWVRYVMLTYFVAFIFLQKSILLFFQQDTSLLIYFLELLYYALVFLPIIFYRKDYGWLHPLILPLLLDTVKRLVASPFGLFEIFFINEYDWSFQINHVLLKEFSASELRYIYIKGQVINIVALLVYYSGYFLFPYYKISKWSSAQIKGIEPKILLVYILTFGVFLFYIAQRGGITSHILSWSQGRFNALAGDGPFFVFIKIGAYACLVWYALTKDAIKSPLFWVMLLSMLPTSFLLTGSRSSLVFYIVLFFIIYVLREKSIPVGRSLGFAFIALFVLSSLGLVRNSAYRGEIDWSSLLNFRILEGVEQAQVEIARRKYDENAYLPLVAYVPNQVNYLWGESYVGSLLFFIPRFMWESKPRGAGALAGERIFGKTSGAGTPPGAVGEAYWNFGYVGVIALFIFYGSLHRSLAEGLRVNPSNQKYWIFYAITLTNFTMASITIVAYLQVIIPVFFLVWWFTAEKKNVTYKVTSSYLSSKN